MNMISRRQTSPFDLFFSDPFDSIIGSLPQQSSTSHLMRADVIDKDDKIEVTIDLPGFDKENVSAELKDGVLKISAETSAESEDSQATYVRKERFSGKCSRSFWVGEDIQEDDIKAKFENGVLAITVPKKLEQAKLEEGHAISID